MPMISIAIGPVLLLWLMVARSPRARWTVASALAALIVLGGTLIERWPQARWEILLACLAPAVALVAKGRKRVRARLAGGLLTGWILVALVGSAAILWPRPFFPSTDTVLPLPDGLRVTVEPYDDSDCRSGSCTRRLTVAGRDGQPEADLYAEVRGHLAARGWGQGCRPVGWLLDRSTQCVGVSVRGLTVVIALSGNRDDLRDLTTPP
ncbi:hypothetical protein QLQ12_39675 [Actinoplanes sp. NEAU-A12]|uniref:Uncharacterized protein n=1 Tax=Actinoplanes sandaracinus TaxID=3045177 RepID=A0ABT6WYA5_9ACTN|nr:hypothetical protein [Actinoplanes sandaracinus]MDI6104728.1 hypothetical protein [Actinoplanes sandaracinus]